MDSLLPKKTDTERIAVIKIQVEKLFDELTFDIPDGDRQEKVYFFLGSLRAELNNQ